MGMSTSVNGIIPPDEKWQQMKEVWEACEKAKIDIPKEVGDFFNWVKPDPKGAIFRLVGDNVVKPYRTEHEEGVEVYLNSLNKNIKILRFINSW